MPSSARPAPCSLALSPVPCRAGIGGVSEIPYGPATPRRLDWRHGRPRTGLRPPQPRPAAAQVTSMEIDDRPPALGSEPAMPCGHFVCASTPFFAQVIPEQQWPEGFRFAGEDRAYWNDRTCGLACLMSIASFHGKPIPAIFELLQEGVGLGHYTNRGWVHAGLAAMGATYGFPGKALPAHTTDDLRSCLESTGSPLIASVTRQFPEDGRRGGHLVVVTAVDGGPMPWICCRDPAGDGMSESRISAARFSASFAGRVIVFP